MTLLDQINLWATRYHETFDALTAVGTCCLCVLTFGYVWLTGKMLLEMAASSRKLVLPTLSAKVMKLELEEVPNEVYRRIKWSIKGFNRGRGSAYTLCITSELRYTDGNCKPEWVRIGAPKLPTKIVEGEEFEAEFMTYLTPGQGFAINQSHEHALTVNYQWEDSEGESYYFSQLYSINTHYVADIKFTSCYVTALQKMPLSYLIGRRIFRFPYHKYIEDRSARGFKNLPNRKNPY